MTENTKQSTVRERGGHKWVSSKACRSIIASMICDGDGRMMLRTPSTRLAVSQAARNSRLIPIGHARLRSLFGMLLRMTCLNAIAELPDVRVETLALHDRGITRTWQIDSKLLHDDREP